MPTQILLIRHGETAWNREKRIQGQEDVPLSPAGVDQARKLGRRLRPLSLAAAYASDLSRALLTAQTALEGTGVPVAIAPAFRERHYGRWQGLTWPEIESRFPQDVAGYQSDAPDYELPGGESWNRMQDRVFSEMKVIAARHAGRTVAVFTHGGPCRAAVMAALGLPAALWRRWTTGNASIHRLIWETSAGGNGLWKLAGYNDVAHLEELDFDEDTFTEKAV